jgi:ribonuclease D
MNAFQPPPPTRQPVEPRRRTAPRAQRRPRHHSYRSIAGETTARLAVNFVLCAAAIAGLVQLLPYHLSQQAKLREVRAEVKRSEERLNSLRADFRRSFDPGQAKSVMQEQSYRVDANQRPVFLQEPVSKEDN